MRSILLGCLATIGFAVPAVASICAAITLPPELGLKCHDSNAAAAAPPSATIAPATSLFSAFTGITIRLLPREEKTDDVKLWLERQVTYDLSGLGSFFSGLVHDPDLPVQNEDLARSLEDTGIAIGLLGDLPLSGCGDPELSSGKADLICHWNTAGIGLAMQVRLVSYGSDRYGLRAWSMNDRRFRQMQALLNGFDPAIAR